MADVNSVILGGNITYSDLSYTPNGLPVLNFSIANRKNYKDSVTDEWKDVTSFIRCSVFGAKAEYFDKKVKVGLPCVVTGELSVKQYEDRDGTKRTSTNVIVKDIEVFEGRHYKNSEN